MSSIKKNLFGTIIARNSVELQGFLDDPETELIWKDEPILILAAIIQSDTNLDIFRQILVSSRINVNDTDGHGHTALSRAVEMNIVAKIEILLNHPSIDITKNNPLSFTTNPVIHHLFYMKHIKDHFVESIAPFIRYRPDSVFVHDNGVYNEFSGLWKL